MTTRTTTPALPRPTAPQDAWLPQLAVALDLRRVSPLLPLPESAVEPPRWEIRSIRYKPRTNCIVLYESLQGGRPTWAYAKLYSEERRPRTASRHRLSVYYPELRMFVSAFPADLHMPALRVATRPGDSYKILRRLVPRVERHRFLPYWEEWQPVRYKPEQSCVMRGRHGSDRDPAVRVHYAEFYAGPDGAKTAEFHRHFDGRGDCGFLTPRLLGFSERFRVMLLAGLVGQPLRLYLHRAEGDAASAVERSAKALAAWRRMPIPATAAPAPSAEEELLGAASTLKALLPDHASECGELAKTLIATEPKPPADSVLLHGDFHHDQVLLDEDHIGLHNLNSLAAGDPAVDVGSFCAHAWYLAVREEIGVERARWLCKLFVSTYEEAAGQTIEPHRLNWHLSAALARLAPAPFRRFDVEWPQRMRTLIGLAELAASGGLS
jgi:hypothetical protein